MKDSWIEAPQDHRKMIGNMCEYRKNTPNSNFIPAVVRILGTDQYLCLGLPPKRNWLGGVLFGLLKGRMKITICVV